MRFYDGLGPNPTAARIALLEKELGFERVEIDITRNESRSADFTARLNPSGTIPVLETDAGVMVSEISAIAEYLEEIAPAPPIIGSSPEERAQTRMWARRLDLEICMALGTAFQAGRARRFFADRKLLPCEQAAEDYLAIGAARLGWLEERMGANRWVCGERFSWADVPLFAFLEFFGTRGRQEEHYPHDGWLDGWRARMRERPSVAAALALAPAPAAAPAPAGA